MRKLSESTLLELERQVMNILKHGDKMSVKQIFIAIRTSGYPIDRRLNLNNCRVARILLMPMASKNLIKMELNLKRYHNSCKYLYSLI